MNVKKLNDLVKQSGKTIRQIQLEADLNSGQLYRILSGVTKDITLTTVFKIADALDVDVNIFRKEHKKWN
ncbi:helix-turn-helix domain-containing protein [Globicatella sanguinis]|uniref:helix-turn-helix domain-containing protein n=1 Tax=Globicatella sanguinis TaxID=13076 RepID=UPI00082647CE|nr:helix-turn-helix transcriptional regulator [Globicatella sanguinis]